ncbi:MAG: ABC transporter substrate-binding protein [Anaerolineae bacterium]|nr:ABC transporter substrate-binding protein [Anaerolineae bacterium]
MNKFTRKNWYVVFVCLIVFSLLATACGKKPQTYTIGLINVLPVLANSVQGFKDGLTELGYIEGENVTYLGGTIPMDQLESTLQDMVNAKVDLILTTTTAASQAAQKATAGTDIPIVFTPLADPVGAGLVDSIKSPGGNITGLSQGAYDAQRLDLFLQIAPDVKKIYVPYNPKDPAPVAGLAAITEVAPKLSVELITQEVNTPDEVTAALANIPEEADAIFLLVDSLVGTRVMDLIKISIEQRLPLSGGNADAVKDGTLCGYGPMQSFYGKQVARMADQILKGTPPSSLPVETAEAYLGINLQTAQAIGLEISDAVLRQADNIIR